MPDRRIAYLDALRGLAAFAVAGFYHYHHFAAPVQPYGHPISAAPFADLPLLGMVLTHGGIAVDFFFVLSGVIFAQVYLERVASGQVSGRQFFLSRFSRLYPVHLLTLLATGALAWAFFLCVGRFPIYLQNGALDFLLNLGFVQHGVFGTRHSFNGPAWSLSVEAVCYGLFFLIARAGLGVRMAGVLLPAGLVLCATQLELPFLLNQAMARGLVGFFGGVLLHHFAFRTSRPGRVLLALGAGIAAAQLLSYWNVPDIAHLATRFIFAAAVVVISSLRPLRRVFELRPLPWLGDMSLSIYLIHVPLQMAILLALELAGKAVPYGNPLFLGGYLVALLALAHLTRRWVERPAQAMLRSAGHAMLSGDGLVLAMPQRPSPAFPL